MLVTNDNFAKTPCGQDKEKHKKMTTMTRGDILIFLDIDGVLLPFPKSDKSSCGAIFPDYCLRALSTILEEIPAAKVILSSTWRAQPNLIAEILESFYLFGKKFGGPLKDLEEFAGMTDPNYHSERQHEIGMYLSEHAIDDIAAWVALDDEELLQGKANEAYRSKFEGHVVKTNSRFGLNARDAAKAIQLLKSQLGQS
jgi:hypothetical protein